MNDLSVLHISDLHIEGGRERYSRLLESLIKDIKKQVSIIEEGKLVIVVTGDIIHKGDKSAVIPAYKFFEDLQRAIGDKVIKIYIVPGNHDKKRTEENKFLVDAYRSMCRFSFGRERKPAEHFGDEFFSSFWRYHIESYQEEHGSGYLELTQKVYQLFGMSEDEVKNSEYITDTFGVDVIKINGRKYNFVLLNTSWSCIDDDDNRNMIFGTFQLKRIEQQFQKYVVEMDDDIRGLTIVLGHHPIDTFIGEEEDRLFANMISFEMLDADVYMCGHTHDKAVINWSNNRHTINTLVSGIGWPERAEDARSNHVGDHTYSIYIFNMDANSVDVFVRGTGFDGKFIPEFKIYTTESEMDSKKIVFPIRSKQAQAHFALSAVEPDVAKTYFMSNSLLQFLRDYALHIGQFCGIMTDEMNNDRNYVYDDIIYEESDTENGIDVDSKAVYDENGDIDEELYNYLFRFGDINGIPQNVKEYFSKYRCSINGMFLGFLQKMCAKIIQVFVGDDIRDGEIIRAHFRYLVDKRSFLYRRLCMSFNDITVLHDNNDVSEMKYSDLIKSSFELQKGLVYDANMGVCENKLKNKWKNFITIVPIFDGNKYTKRMPTGRNAKEYPYITFGLTTNTNRFNWLFYCMDYFSIKTVLEEIIEQYVQLFDIDLGAFCEWAKDFIEDEEVNSEGI